VGGNEWVLLFYPTGQPGLYHHHVGPHTAIFVALVGEGPQPQGVVTLHGRRRHVHALHRFTLVDQSNNGRNITKESTECMCCVPQGQQPNILDGCDSHGHKVFVEHSVLEAPDSGYLVNDVIRIRYEIELVATSGGALHPPVELASIDVSSIPTLGDQMRALLLLDDEDTTDCVFEVEGERFPAHSLIISARSSAFRAMLRTGAQMREGHEGVVRQQDIRASVFKLLLHFIYSDSLPGGNCPEAFGASGGASGAGVASAAGRPLLGGGSGGSGDDGVELDVPTTQHLLVAADRFDLARLRAICESRLCDTAGRCSLAQ
jgi:speckle-type POZ protein